MWNSGWRGGFPLPFQKINDSLKIISWNLIFHLELLYNNKWVLKILVYKNNLVQNVYSREKSRVL